MTTAKDFAGYNMKLQHLVFLLAKAKARLSKKEVERERAERNRIANATRKLRTKYDDVKETTWYYDRNTPSDVDYNSFHLYMGKKRDGTPWLRFKINYAADDWLFIESYIVKTDGNIHTITPEDGEVKRDNGSGKIWEWYGVPMNNELLGIVQDVINSKS